MEKSLEQTLIHKAKAGDGRAVEVLVRAHQASLYAFMLRFCRRPEVAEDIVQESFVRVLKNLDRFDTRFRFSTWIFTIAKRLYVNAQQKLSPSFDTDAVGLRPGSGATPSGETAAAESRANVRLMLEAALDGLNDQQREIILLFHQQNWPISDIAAHMRMPEGTVKSHLHRGRKRMKEVIMGDARMSRQVQEAWS